MKQDQGVLEAAGRVMVRWHEDEAQLGRQRRASAVPKGMGGGGATGGVEENPTKGMRGKGATTGEVEGKPQWTKVGGRWQTG